MKSKYRLYLLVVVFAVCACQQEDSTFKNPAGKELSFTPVVEYMSLGDTRAVGDSFFADGNNITIHLVTSDDPSTVKSIEYTYGSDHIFRGNPGYRFTLDDSYIDSLSARWPAEEVRSGELVTDQRELENYRLADWLSGGVSNSIVGIVPTDAPVPLVFEHENILLVFELVGQNTTGLGIESLLIELEGGDTDKGEAFWAYCGNPNGKAELILPPGSKILSPDNYLIGRLRVEGETNDFTVIFPKTELYLQPGHRYLITLTPQGYLMDAYVYLAGFVAADGGIGIPFAPPTPDENGNFIISTAQQLIGFSYLIRHYNDGRTFVWSERTYIIADEFTITAEEASQYIPVSASLFTGRVEDTRGNNITEIPYGMDDVLPLFN